MSWQTLSGRSADDGRHEQLDIPACSDELGRLFFALKAHEHRVSVRKFRLHLGLVHVAHFAHALRLGASGWRRRRRPCHLDSTARRRRSTRTTLRCLATAAWRLDLPAAHRCTLAEVPSRVAALQEGQVARLPRRRARVGKVRHRRRRHMHRILVGRTLRDGNSRPHQGGRRAGRLWPKGQRPVGGDRLLVRPRVVVVDAVGEDHVRLAPPRLLAVRQ
mmetsp:Transcript_10066/g.31905  ORF Transcript_10066/g.31905 Transcript_10066/m.31905 type:complete len:218 (-) Transcript_10066:187-840(-)